MSANLATTTATRDFSWVRRDFSWVRRDYSWVRRNGS